MNTLAYALSTLIAILLLTGGVHYSSPQFKIELSQVDIFAWALLAVLGLRRWLYKKWFPDALEARIYAFTGCCTKKPRLVLGIATGIYVVLMTWNAAWRFDSFHASAFDLGFIDQSLWSTTRVGFLHSSLSKGQTYLGEHFAPLLGLVALIYRLSESIYLLFFFQSLTLASGAALVYALARQKKLPAWAATLAALCFLAYQPLRLANNFDFREDDLFVPIFLAALLALERRSWLSFWGLCLTSWLVKESAPLFTFLMGGWLLIDSVRIKSRRHWRAHGAALALISVAVFFIVNTKITPMFVGSGPGADTMLTKRLRQFGDTNTAILKFAVSHPVDFAASTVQPLLQKSGIKYFLNVMVPFLWAASAAPIVFLIVLAGISMNLLVNQPTIGFHYECVLIPFLFLILIEGLTRLHRSGKLSGATVPGLMLLSFLLFFGRSPIDSIRRHAPTERDRFVASELRGIPQTASIATQSVLHPHLTHRRNAYLFSSAAPAADYIIVDLAPNRDRYGTPNLEADAARIDASLYRLIFDRDSLKVWRRLEKE